mgnify:CR=1 FL=1
MTEFSAPNPDFADVVNSSFAAQTMMTTLGATLDTVAPGFCRIHSTIPPGARVGA